MTRRRDLEDDVDELFGRVVDLERVPPSTGSGGIQFGIENDGNWLDVRTDDNGPSSYGIYLHADVASIATPGIALSSDGIIAISTNHLTLGADSQIDITPTIVTVGGNQALFPREIRMQLANTTTTPQGSKFVVYDSNLDPVFEVRDDGTVHILTGTAPVADL